MSDVEGKCDNCGKKKVIYDATTNKYWCCNCMKVRQHNFTIKNDVE